ncbi:hypothetical protein CVT26_012296 [Gymnopilus dilepis]|uniref:Phosphatidylinositol transfer protein SFH5 n=1 Tax=Gymnopilus dilepis TaxID=231916 RepID=A0A409YW82_9AGAR|nr:hypothetical protein CVT26_012296 [Gymnopilus dilepis]
MSEPTTAAPVESIPATQAEPTEPTTAPVKALEPTATSEETPAAPAETTAAETTAAKPSQAPEPTQGQPAAEPTATSSEKPASSAEEPQSPLTKKFTDAEWKALTEFRRQLPDIFADGFPDNPKAKEQPITFWGVTIDPAHPEKDARVSVILMKFLRARNLSISEAREMLVNTFRWRTSIDIDAVMKEEFPQDIFGNLGHIYGHDKEGRPVVYNIYGGNQDLKAVFGDVQRFIRWRVAFMEKSVAQLDFLEIDQMIQVHGTNVQSSSAECKLSVASPQLDYEGVSFTSRDANSKAAASEATNIFQSHYPELLYKKFFINVPTILNWVFWIFKPLLSANTLAKMSVAGTGHHAIKKALLPFINADQLPKRYGGEAEAF